MNESTFPTRRRPVIHKMTVPETANNEAEQERLQVEANLKELAILKMKISGMEKRTKELETYLKQRVPALGAGRLTAVTVFGAGKVQIEMYRTEKAANSVNKAAFIADKGNEVFIELASISQTAIADHFGKIEAGKYIIKGKSESIKIDTVAIS